MVRPPRGEWRTILAADDDGALRPTADAGDERPRQRGAAPTAQAQARFDRRG
jgi:hypothetical protein